MFDKFKGIAADMINFDSFLAVVGFFRSSGYFKLRKELGNVSEIKILVGINIDDIFRKHNKALLMSRLCRKQTCRTSQSRKIIYQSHLGRI